MVLEDKGVQVLQRRMSPFAQGTLVRVVPNPVAVDVSC